jgi:phosphoribosylanthranilate isomerase
MTNRPDVRAAIDAGVDALGFVLVPGSPRVISLDLATELMSGVEQTTFLLTHDLDPDALVSAALASGATGVQPYGRYVEEASAAASEVGLMVLRPTDPGNAWRSVPSDQYPFFDSKGLDGTGRGGMFDHDLLPLTDRPFVVAGGLNPHNVERVIETRQPFGVDVSSGVESRPGQKDHKLLREMVGAVRRLG